jgi:uncharacterized membrane protein SpoIIM required for sporulation
MLEEIFLLEEEHHNFGRLMVLGLLAGVAGFIAASVLFPTQSDILAVIFASVPMIYSLTEKFLNDEAENRPHIPEVETYLSIFAGMALAFFILAVQFPESFEVQRAVIGASGAAVSQANFQVILSNNLMVFSAVFLLAMLIGSAGAFVLTWNASVLGVFLARVAESSPVMVLGYLPHTLFEISGFVIGGIAGSLISAAVYRRHFDRETWMDYLKLISLGVLCIFIGAFLETA